MIESLLHDTAERMETLLDTYTKDSDHDYPAIFEAMRYSLLSGGKRIRPFLVTAFCVLFDGSRPAADAFASALEMIHTYSLIHDDLPCMDNDDFRRGRPTNHKVYGEAPAVLAGDALLTKAFETAAAAPDVPAEVTLAAVRLLAQKAGTFGMIGGQMLDLRGETETLDFEQLLKMHALKTGALIECACLLGCFSAGLTDLSDLRCQAARTYAKNIGLAFQIIDDRLDAVSTDEVLGKPVGSDKDSQKTTFLSFMNPDQAFDYAKDLTEQAKEALAGFEENTILCEFADFLLTRVK